MKRVVMDSGLLDSEIRPQPLLSEFRRQSIEDAKSFFSDASLFVEVPCPACDSSMVSTFNASSSPSRPGSGWSAYELSKRPRRWISSKRTVEFVPISMKVRASTFPCSSTMRPSQFASDRRRWVRRASAVSRWKCSTRYFVACDSR